MSVDFKLNVCVALYYLAGVIGGDYDLNPQLPPHFLPNFPQAFPGLLFVCI
jgi:hypothetical protein